MQINFLMVKYAKNAKDAKITVETTIVQTFKDFLLFILQKFTKSYLNFPLFQLLL